MGYKQTATATGGGPAVGLADSLAQFFQSGLKGNFAGGQNGPAENMGKVDPGARTGGIASVLDDILSAGGGKVGGALQEIIQQDVTKQVGDVRGRFGASGGTSRGSPAAIAESMIRSQSAPAITSAIGGLQMSALTPILSLITQFAGKGVAQREEGITAEPNPFLTFLQAISGGAQGAGSLITGIKSGK